MIGPGSWARGYLRARPRVHAQVPSLMQARLSLYVVVMFRLFGVRELWRRNPVKSARWTAYDTPIRGAKVWMRSELRDEQGTDQGPG